MSASVAVVFLLLVTVSCVVLGMAFHQQGRDGLAIPSFVVSAASLVATVVFGVQAAGSPDASDPMVSTAGESVTAAPTTPGPGSASATGAEPVAGGTSTQGAAAPPAAPREAEARGEVEAQGAAEAQDKVAAPPVAGEPQPAAAPVPVAVVRLPSVGGTAVTAYFGRLSPLMARLDGKVTFATDPGYRTSHPDQCAGTVVVGPLPGTTARIYAQGLGEGWAGAENEPDASLGAGATAHQQLVVPPESAAPGFTRSVGAAVDGDGATFRTGTYSLFLVEDSADGQRWKAGGTLVSCTR